MDEQKRELDERDEMLRMIARLAKEKERARQQASKASDYDWLRGLSEPSPQVQKAPFVLDTSADDLWRLDEIGRTPHSQPPPTTPTARRPDQKRNASRAPQTHPQKKGRVKRVFAFSLVLVVAAAVLLFAAVNSAAGKVRQLEIDPADASVIATPQGRSLVTNILLLGADGSGSSGLRSDTMLLLSIDRVHRKLKLTSFLRDSWVQLPNGNHAKLNAALSTGGVSTALRAISTNFDVRLDHYALVNFDSFKEVVDALGGVAVPITE
ncbi:MAG: LCP family protein, partial [Oscillospiraceae bacterium]|nr:LCP family protein [Oscillospiraceae bacterium]